MTPEIIDLPTAITLGRLYRSTYNCFIYRDSDMVARSGDAQLLPNAEGSVLMILEIKLWTRAAYSIEILTVDGRHGWVFGYSDRGFVRFQCPKT